ncbi:putative minor tail protein [Edwardsiella phage eiAU-183]|uniref:Putative minor tail protein n=4 Tax=Viruses TaxID=10239 RepID=E7EKQ7_9CAUD|nr:minor tail protein [Edwardsiella phage eiAU-183]YP_009613854.1 minor tail protein [Edwardsiella phage eiAU]ADV36466.1 putative phage minor tail protein [Edwardsiella phage eiDWF]ADV36516.1 putative phage minor tail protein [Edwardsiella phage eiMSLS]ADV36412.1 putative phage minor tail protein [Edwardsiella phage eiAU]AHG23420.1 putative minor tail protein [Edwardsiella phage eiAU]AHG23474.1 putative minor tail protein [Edwardsiella phage eiAU-183]
MNKIILGEIKKHAAESGYNECCGLVVQNGRALRYIRVTNTHEMPTEHFRISAADFAAAADEGDIVRVIHSHPGDGATAEPSDADKAACNASGIIWGVYAPDCDEYREISPQDPPLIGRPFVLGADDCYGLVMAWHKRQGIDLLDFRVNYPWWERGENLYMDNWAAAGFVEADPAPGCVVIMQVRADVPNHAGVLTECGLLHHLYGRASEEIPYGGYYVDRTVLCIRHRDLPEELKPWRD